MKPSALRLDWVCPPFAGHLFPVLLLARGLAQAGFERSRVFSCPSARAAVEGMGLEFVSLLADREDEILSIANTAEKVGSRPGALLAQFKSTLGVLGAVGDELQTAWVQDAPDVVLADRVLPTAGLAARQCGAAWWTTMTSISPTETPDGTPAYLGGWEQRRGVVRGWRDAFGRRGTRAFKRGLGWLARRELRAIGLPSMYRTDGAESFYSDERILALGAAEFEFERSWPAALKFVGPLQGSPVHEGRGPRLAPGRVHVLVTLGTHLKWAKPRALARVRELARLRPEWTLHFSHGDSNSDLRRTEGNLEEYGYLPYGELLGQFDAALVHGGSGIVYSCLAAGLPMLVWPHDYDQFDHAARIAVRGWGLRARGDATRFASDLARLLGEPRFREACAGMRAQLERYDPVAAVSALLGELADAR